MGNKSATRSEREDVPRLSVQDPALPKPATQRTCSNGILSAGTRLLRPNPDSHPGASCAGKLAWFDWK